MDYNKIHHYITDLILLSWLKFSATLFPVSDDFKAKTAQENLNGSIKTSTKHRYYVFILTIAIDIYYSKP